jgi:hypothetical protein
MAKGVEKKAAEAAPAWSGTLAFHRFTAERGGDRYGDEIDVEVRWTSGWRQPVAVKLAQYRGDGFAADIDKWMLWTDWRF